MWASNRFAMGSTATKLAETGSNQILYSKKTKTVRNMILKKKGFFIPLFVFACLCILRKEKMFKTRNLISRI